MYRLCTVAAVLITLFDGARAAAAQTPDEKELAGYRLTMAAVRQVDGAFEVLFAELKTDPRFQEHVRLTAQIEALEAREERTEGDEERLEQLRAKLEALQVGQEVFPNAETLSAMEVAIRRTPQLARALRSVGMPPREYAKVMLTLLTATMAASIKKSGGLTQLPRGVSAENLKFVEDHEAELMALQKKWETMGKRSP